MHALMRLSLWQIKNAARAGLRNPAVWIPMLLIALLAGTRFGELLSPQSPLPSELGQWLRQHVAAVHAIVFLVLALLALAYIDSGLAGGALRFSSPDVALLFPAPFSRRLVLLFKLPSALSQHLLMIAFLAGGFRVFVWLPLQQQGHIQGGGWPAFLAAVLCVAGFLNLSIMLDLFSEWERHAWVKWSFRLAAFAAIVGLTWFLWTHGMEGLLALDKNRLLSVVFSPCRMAADVVTAPFLNLQLSGLPWVILFVWCGLTLGLLFTRRVNYYESAALGAEQAERVRQAVRSGNWAAIRNQPARAGGLTVAPFGRGGGALAWAHLAAAAKRPGVNFVLPFLGGLSLTLLVILALLHWIQGASDVMPFGVRITILIATGYYVLYAVALLSTQFYQRSLARETLMRPLPISMSQIVAAEVGTRSLLGSLFPFGEGLALLVLHPPNTGALPLQMLVCVPALIVVLNILGYRLALAYPNRADKFQTLAASFVQFAVYGLLSAVVMPFGIIPALLHAPEWLTTLSLTLGLSLVAGFLFRDTVRAAQAFESSEELPRAITAHWVKGFRKGISSSPLKKAVKPLIIIAVILLILASISRRTYQALHKPPAPPRTVETRRGDLVVNVSESGTIQPVDKINVESKAPGRLLSIPVTEGEQIQRGQLIAVVDRSQLDPQIAGLRAQLNQAQARLAQTEAQYTLQVRQTQMAVAQAQAGLHSAQTHLAAVAAGARPQELAQQTQAVDRARITLEDAKRTQVRKQGLLAKGFIAQSDADSAQVAVDTAASNLATAQQALALTQAGPRPQDVTDARSQVMAQNVALQTAQANIGQLAVSHADIDQARASVAQIQNQLAQMLVQLADTRIVAPAAGIVLKKYKQPDEIVQSATTGFSDAQSLIVTLGSRLEVLVGINEVDIPKVRVGAPVTIHVDAVPNTAFTGSVTEVAPASTNAFADTSNGASTGDSISKFNVKVALSHYDPRLRPGMTADVDIVSAHHFHVVLAPQEAVSETGKKATVTVLSPAGVKEQRPVTLGLRDDTNVEIVQGLRPNEKLVVLPIDGKGRRKFNVNGDGS
jgi:HlyD family secretion protein